MTRASRSTAVRMASTFTAPSRRQRRALLAPGGDLVVELGAGQAPAVAALFAAAGLAVTGIRNDLLGIPRALSARIPA